MLAEPPRTSKTLSTSRSLSDAIRKTYAATASRCAPDLSGQVAGAEQYWHVVIIDYTRRSRCYSRDRQRTRTGAAPVYPPRIRLLSGDLPRRQVPRREEDGGTCEEGRCELSLMRIRTGHDRTGEGHREAEGRRSPEQGRHTEGAKPNMQ